MKRIIFPMILLLSIPFAMNAMQNETPKEQEKESSLLKLEYTGPDRMIYTIDTRRLSRNVIPGEKHKYLAEQMQMMSNELQRSTLPNDTLIKFQNVILEPTEPWKTEEQKVRDQLHQQIRELKSNLEKHVDNGQASAFRDAEKKFPCPAGWNKLYSEVDNLNEWETSIKEEKEALRKLMAARYATHLLRLQELDETSKAIKNKLNALLPQATTEFEKEQSSGEHIPA